MLYCTFPVLLCMACGGGDSEVESDINSITLSATSLDFSCDSESQTVSITTDHEWAAKVSETWISVDPPYSTSRNATLTVRVQKMQSVMGVKATLRLCQEAVVHPL